MSIHVERVVGRAVTDKPFREALLADPEAAVRDAGLVLSAAELTEIKVHIAKAKLGDAPEHIHQRLELSVRGIW